MQNFVLAIGIIFGLTTLNQNAVAQSLTGTASVIDGDTIEIRGQRIRLHGIDAPESGQSCKINGSEFSLWPKSGLRIIR